MDEENTIKKAELNDRIKQIRLVLFDDNNRKFASEIGEIEQTMSQICLNKRNAGLEIVQKILNNLPEIDANWLLRGKGNMTIDRSGKSVSVQDSPQATISNGDMAINAPAELLNLLTSQQETIKRLTEIIANTNK
jgi:hypothetical protein